MDTLTFYTYSIWLFTVSDLKTIIVPTLVFGVSNALAISSYDLKTLTTVTNWEVAQRIPLAASWAWLHLLSFNINK